jgi:enoyl-CoA hydratase/carnithine racemase
MTERIRRRDTGGLCTLTLNRPEKLNALDEATFEELADHVSSLESDDAITCVVLRGAGRSFCAGNDLEDIAAGKRSEDPHFRGKTIERLANLPQPLVAAIQGHCYTGGLELALAADLLVATESARFADTHGKWGLTPLWGMSQRLPRRVGVSRAKELMFTSRTVSAPEALAIGLVDGCVPDDRFDEEIEGLVSAILQNSSFSNRANKHMLEATDGMPLVEGLRFEREKSPGMAPDARERIATFTKRKS